jgi:small subunit ribosomal protein S6
MFIVNPELGEEETEALLQRIRGYLVDAGGDVTFSDDWGVRRLAYQIKGQREGHYYLTRFTMDSGEVKEFERRLLLAEDVLRTLIVRLDSQAVGEVEEPPPPTAE